MTAQRGEPAQGEAVSGLYRLVQRRGSAVAHALPFLDGGRSTTTLCAQSAPGHSSWPVQPDELPLCKRCARLIEARR